MFNNKIPPQDSEAETGIIAAILLDGDFCKPFVIDLDCEIFYTHAHRLIMQAQINLLQKDIHVDIISTINELGSNVGQIKDIDYLAQILDNHSSAVNVQEYIRIVEEKYYIREIIRMSDDMSRKGYDGTLSIEEYLVKNKELVDLLYKGNQKDFNLSEAIMKTMDFIESETKKGIPTGFSKLDRIIGGFMPTDLIVVGGRPSMGKTSLVVSMMSSILFHEKRILFFSLEMNQIKIINRILSIRSGVSVTHLKGGQKLKKSDWGKIAHSSAELNDQDLIIDERPGVSIHDIRKTSYMYNYKKPIDIIFIDYLQRMKHDTHKSGNIAHEIGQSVVELKSLAKELDIPVVLLSQLNREIASRKEPEPRPSDMKSSGDIEQEADIIIFPWRPSEISMEGEDRLIVGKNRDGPKDIVMVDWIEDTAQFKEKGGICAEFM